MKNFWQFWWVAWFVMLVVGDPIASWLGNRDHVGDQYTDTHLIVTHLNEGLRCAVLGWLIWHFLFAHRLT